MGLDMYLTKRTYVKNWEHTPKEERWSILIKRGGKTDEKIDKKRIAEIVEEVGYWRKANAIHDWFVQNVQDGDDNCSEYYVPSEKLKELYDVVCKVLKNHSLAEELLPTSSGFFFGSTEYDECYWEDLESTKKILEEALKDEGGSFYYQSSW